MNNTQKALNYYKTAAIQNRKSCPKPLWVPKTIILSKTIRGDFPLYHHIVAEPGKYEAYCNPYGAVSVKTPNGDLGLRLDEFEVLDWQENSKI